MRPTLRIHFKAAIERLVLVASVLDQILIPIVRFKSMDEAVIACAHGAAFEDGLSAVENRSRRTVRDRLVEEVKPAGHLIMMAIDIPTSTFDSGQPIPPAVVEHRQLLTSDRHEPFSRHPSYFRVASGETDALGINKCRDPETRFAGKRPMLSLQFIDIRP
jgi:hypothetical protein